MNPEVTPLDAPRRTPLPLHALVLGAALCLAAPAPANAEVANPAAQDRSASAEAIAAATRAHLARAQSLLDGIVAQPTPRTVENTLAPMNELSIALDAAANLASLMENVHPDAAVRAAAEKATQEVQAFNTALSLNRQVYDALQAVDASKADPVTQRHLRLLLRDYRRSGVDKDEATRARIQALRDSLVKIGQEFDRNIREGTRSIYVTAAELEGLSPDYVAAHKPDSTGGIRITTEYPDYVPFMNYSKSADARRRLQLEYLNRAYPQNKDVLLELAARREELARLVGYPTWADYIYEDKMAKSPAGVESFIEALDEATERRGREDYELLLARKRRDDPRAEVIHDWERRYYSELVRSERFQLDPQELRAYFNFPQAKQGILDITSRMFGVEYRRVPDAKVWHPEVECYDVLDGGRLLGRFYLDMHPREGKYSHAAQFPMVGGVRDRQVPEAALVCNLPRPDAEGVGLMEQEDFETFLHEFGHLLHTLFGGQQAWIDRSGISTEWDFVEAPSSMLEEWAADARTLQTFARHYKTGQAIPEELVRKLRAARDFGNGLYVRQQTYYSALSLECYNKPAAQVDPDALNEKLQKEYTPFPFTPGTHMYASFGHLEGYSAMYYTYMWSLVIAKDLLSRFDTRNLLDPKVATEYRRKVLAPGGTRDAAELVEDFLGRPYSFKAFEEWLNRGAGT